jgi:hypothetical protein
MSISSLHECNESKDENKLLVVLLDETEINKKKSTMNYLYEDVIEYKLQQNIHDINKKIKINIQT